MAAGEWGRTMLVLTSDHGEQLGGHRQIILQARVLPLELRGDLAMGDTVILTENDSNDSNVFVCKSLRNDNQRQAV